MSKKTSPRFSPNEVLELGRLATRIEKFNIRNLIDDGHQSGLWAEVQVYRSGDVVARIGEVSGQMNTTVLRVDDIEEQELR